MGERRKPQPPNMLFGLVCLFIALTLWVVINSDSLEPLDSIVALAAR